eukprot:108347-Chlamydomonas_euryale.AAC.5
MAKAGAGMTIVLAVAFSKKWMLSLSACADPWLQQSGHSSGVWHKSSLPARRSGWRPRRVPRLPADGAYVAWPLVQGWRSEQPGGQKEGHTYGTSIGTVELGVVTGELLPGRQHSPRAGASYDGGGWGPGPHELSRQQQERRRHQQQQQQQRGPRSRRCTVAPPVDCVSAFGIA